MKHNPSTYRYGWDADGDVLFVEINAAGDYYTVYVESLASYESSRFNACVFTCGRGTRDTTDYFIKILVSRKIAMEILAENMK